MVIRLTLLFKTLYGEQAIEKAWDIFFLEEEVMVEKVGN